MDGTIVCVNYWIKGKNMFKIQTLNAISATGLNHFTADRYQVANESTHPDAILVRSFVMHDYPISDSVKAIGRAGAGTNNIPVAELTKRGIPVFNSPGANANAVRELVLAGMLLASRNIHQALEYLTQLKTDESKLEAEIEQNKKKFVGFELHGKTLGVIGLGSIGVKVANAANSLGMKVIGYDPTISVNRAWELSANVKQAHTMANVLEESDFVSFHVPLIEETKKMVNSQRFAQMKRGIVVLNFAREGIIDHTALLAALDNKTVHTYVTDFPNVLIKNHPNVINLPHLGASTLEAEENCAVMVVKQLKEFLENGSIINAVNFPPVELSANFKTRIAIVNANIPNMVAQISSVLGNAKLNITSLVNKSLENIAYTVIDVDRKINEDTLKEIKSIEGVIQVRVLTA